MTKQLREFAETILEHITKHDCEMGPAYTRDYEREGGPALQEQYELAAAWLAEHPPDDDDPVTVEWLRDISHSSAYPATISLDGLNGKRWLMLFVESVCIYHPSSNGGCIILYDIAPVKNRGDVRRLCRALGV